MMDPSEVPSASAIYDQKTSPYYSWTIAKDQMMIFGGAFPLDAAPANFSEQRKRVEKAGIVMGNVLRKEACLLNYPTSLKDIELGNDGVFLIGEAAGWISPSSFEGISWAFNSAIACSKLFVRSHLNHDLYRQHCQFLYPKLWQKIIKARILYHPFLRKIILKSTLFSIDIK